MLKFDFKYKLGNGAELTVVVNAKDFVNAGEQARKELKAVVGDQSSYLLDYCCQSYI